MVFIPEGYKSILDYRDTQKASCIIKDSFEERLNRKLNLQHVESPLFVEEGSGINDILYARPLVFDTASLDVRAEIVESLGKWKRLALHKYGFHSGEGINAYLRAVRRDEKPLDNLHSLYVDQWDWEKVIRKEDRNLDYLTQTAEDIVNAVCDVQDIIIERYPELERNGRLERKISVISSQELEDMYPELSPAGRENEYLREHGTAFITGIGGALRSGIPHGLRYPDCDDWSMDGDIFFYDPVLDCAFEISSMAVRTDPETMERQLKISGYGHRLELPYHKMLMEGELPYTAGGGIGQSRLVMLLLGKAHIGEVQVSIWDEANISACKDAGIMLL